MSQKRPKIMSILSHEYLWTPTPVYYFITLALFSWFKKKYSL
jgi:hypothetical protein